MDEESSDVTVKYRPMNPATVESTKWWSMKGFKCDQATSGNTSASASFS